MTDATPLLEVNDLSVTYKGIRTVNNAVNGASFKAAGGEVVGIVGESGSGKSTAALALLGLTRYGGTISGGSVKFEGRELLGSSESAWRKIRGNEIALVTQNPRGALNPVVQVGDQITTIYRAHRDVGKQEAYDRSLELLRLVGINDPERRLKAFPHELSGGMAQRVLIAMALACTPKLLLADEPTSGLDVTVQAQLLDDLRNAAAEVGSSVVLVSQDLGIVANYCNRVYLMHAGEILEQAPTREFFGSPSNPATTALLAAHRSDSPVELKLQGFPVDGRKLPSGCWLHPRCPFAEADKGCTSVHPELREIGPEHRTRCHRAEHVRAEAKRLMGAKDQLVADVEASLTTTPTTGSQ